MEHSNSLVLIQGTRNGTYSLAGKTGKQKNTTRTQCQLNKNKYSSLRAPAPISAACTCDLLDANERL